MYDEHVPLPQIKLLHSLTFVQETTGHLYSSDKLEQHMLFSQMPFKQSELLKQLYPNYPLSLQEFSLQLPETHSKLD